MHSCRSFALLVLLVVLSGSARAQHADTTVISWMQGLELEGGTLLQTDLKAGRENSGDGFSIRRARLKLSGTAAPLDFFLQTELTDAPVILDAGVRLPLIPRVTLTTGLYKAPFSRGVLTSSSDLLLTDRARVIGTLAPGRQVGAHLSTELSRGLTLQAGLFNGNGTALSGNDNDQFLYVGRLTGTLPLDGGSLHVGANAGYSKDDRVDLGAAAQSFDGSRTLLGVDAELHTERWVLTGEFLTARLEPDASGDTRWPTGGHLTGGVLLADRHQLLVRYDHIDLDAVRRNANDAVWTAGYTFYVSSTVKGQANYSAPGDELTDGLVTFRLQVAIN